MNSAASSHRRIQSINHKLSRPQNRNSLNEIVVEKSRKSSQFVNKSGNQQV